ncbi:MAG: hypothetical protein WD342_00165 [Verrucomicrobiales bacterium]
MSTPTTVTSAAPELRPKSITAVGDLQSKSIAEPANALAPTSR